ncbi:Aquaporin-10 [Hondaea fermentalgiana]|uniref:Aquaporin-10 n=1 Tax=Hondaea fermentalgiana TaxID=2315210 RepID=A0A2R5GS48_9STRA|nr:Aquaporin-10 [Hondaea fermentalgiana]|eukprot:GBG33702.1 Aquaporin-10 [Hondaea fermentalgiana]
MSDHSLDLEGGAPAEDMQAKYGKFIKRLRGEPTEDADAMRSTTLRQEMVAEAVGTGFIVLFGVGVVNTAVLTGAQAGIFQVAIVWGIGIGLAILTTASLSGAHLNPAVSLAFALMRPDDFPFRKLIPYIGAQFAGSIICAAVNYLIFSTALSNFEEQRGIVRGEPGSEQSAMVFGEYFPNPDFAASASLGWSSSTVSPLGSLGIEALGTGILMFNILGLTDARNQMRIGGAAKAFGIGLTVTVLISLYAPLNQAGFNPARDFGPRIVAFLAGWGEIAIPGPQGGFWTYILGPLIGAPLGAAFYDFVLMRGL